MYNLLTWLLVIGVAGMTLFILASPHFQGSAPEVQIIRAGR